MIMSFYHRYHDYNSFDTSMTRFIISNCLGTFCDCLILKEAPKLADHDAKDNGQWVFGTHPYEEGGFFSRCTNRPYRGKNVGKNCSPDSGS
jgi:hypothetical protein